MVFGTFDLLHEGHLFLIRHASKRGDVTVVVAESENVKRIKGRLPIETNEERMKAIQLAFPSVQVILGDKKDFLAPLKIVTPDLLILGYDQKLPPGVTETDLPCRVERAPAHRPDIFKSSLMKKR